MNLPILRVALPTPLRKLFDYLPPDPPEPPSETNSLVPTLVPGLRVLVPFGTKLLVGIIVEISSHSEIEGSKLKKVHAILDKEPIFSESLFNLIQWTSQYYHHPLGVVFETAMPKWFRTGKPPVGSQDSIISKEISSSQNHFLNSEQERALKNILHSFGKFQPILLEGITGSGKTEVYLQAIAHAIQHKKQAILLVPEIGLTPQMISRFEERFPNENIVVLHSSISEKKQALAFSSAKNGEASIILGTRSCAFTPLKHPGLFIIDEEHDTSFKQQEGLRYSARDLMIKRGSLENCPIVLGSATPSLETLYNAQKGRYQHLQLKKRAGNALSPTLQVLDIRHKKLEEGLSAQLIGQMKEHLQNNGQVLLFLNRRGFAPVWMCFDCNWTATCKHCDAKLTVHFQSQQLRCHHCEFNQPLIKKCGSCQSAQCHPIGVGTERLEAILQQYFPDKKIVRIDKDTTRKKGSFKEAVQSVQSGEAHILLGTQMIAKGHHFPNLTLVAILNIDSALFSSDFRSFERLGQLLVQVSGRAGREEKPGHVLLQTAHPEHPLLKLLLNEGYHALSNKLLNERQLTGLPPLSYQALFRSEAKTKEKSMQFLNFIKMQLKKIQSDKTQHLKNLESFGPVPAPMEKRLGKYRAQLLLQSSSRQKLHDILQSLLSKIEDETSFRYIRWSLDIDPQDMY